MARDAQSEGTDFDQSRFGHPDLTNFGQSIFGQSIWICVCHGGAPSVEPKPRKNRAPKGGVPKGGALKGGGPNISRFFPSTAPIFALLYLSGCLLVEFWWCFLKRRNPDMFTFGVLGLSCETPAASAPHDNLRTPNVNMSGFRRFKNTTKIPREDTQRDTKERKWER